MPFKSQAQRRKFYAMADRGEISKSTVEKWEAHTPKGKKLPERVKKASLDKLSFQIPTVVKTTGLGVGLGGLTGAAMGAALPKGVLPDVPLHGPTMKDRMRAAAVSGLTGAVLGGLSGFSAAARLRATQAEQEAWRQHFRYRYRPGYRGSSGAARAAPVSQPPNWMGPVKTKAEAKAAFRREAMKHHPDRGGSEEAMKQVNVEWDRFSNSPTFNKLAAAFLDELTKIAFGDLAGIVLSQLARREINKPVDAAVKDLEDNIAEKWTRFSTQAPLGY